MLINLPIQHLAHMSRPRFSNDKMNHKKDCNFLNGVFFKNIPETIHNLMETIRGTMSKLHPTNFRPNLQITVELPYIELVFFFQEP